MQHERAKAKSAQGVRSSGMEVLFVPHRPKTAVHRRTAPDLPDRPRSAVPRTPSPLSMQEDGQDLEVEEAFS